jgi:hypothetical protein
MPTLRLLPAVLLLFGVATAQATWDEFILITSDYSTVGYVCSVQRASPWTVASDLEDVYQDAVARWHAGLYYVINRGDASNLQILDPAAGYQTIRQFSLGAGRGPSDIAFRDDGIAFVSCYDTAELLKVDVEGGSVLDSYSTAAWADADGIPETGWMQAVGNRLFITCLRLDRNNYSTPAGGSCLLVFDMAAEAWVDAIPATPEIDAIALTGENPYPKLELSRDRTWLRVGCTGWYGLLDGGIEVVELDGLTSLGFEISEAELGGDLLDFERVGTDAVWVVVSDPSFRTSIRRQVRDVPGVEVLYQSATYGPVDIACDGASYVYAGDRTPGNAGLRVFAVASGSQLTAAPIFTGLPPALIVLPVDEALTAVPPGGSPSPEARLTLEAPWPNPANPTLQLRLRGPADTIAPLGIYDLRGRRLRTALVSLDGRGLGIYVFDGRDDQGGAVASGVYQARAGEGPGTAVRRFTLVR